METSRNFAKLDPRTVIRSQWTDGDDSHYLTVAFERLKRSIEHTGGNVSPIKVRPVHDGRFGFEIVLGHARHRACLELGLPVAAVVEEMSDLQLVQQFITHQLFKKWSPWRTGAVMNRAIDHGLFPSLRKAAEQLGMEVTDCWSLIALYRLPVGVKRRLMSITLTPASAKRLVRQWERDPAGPSELGAMPKALRVLYEAPAA